MATFTWWSALAQDPIKPLNFGAVRSRALGMTSTRARRGVAASLLPLSVAAVLASSPATAAPTTVTVEGEQMTAVSGRSVAVVDAAASQRRAMKMATDGTISSAVRTPASRRLVLRLRGDQFAGAPRAVVRVDGQQVAAIAVRATRWTEYVVPGTWTAGKHRVDVSYVNDLSLPGIGNRNLRVDWVRFVATKPDPVPTPVPTPVPSGSSTPSPTPSPSASPLPTASPTATPTPTRVPTPSPAPTTGQLDDAYEARIVELVNAERAKAGLRSLAVSACADRYAEEWSAHMASTGQFQHRSDLGAVMRSCSARLVGENIAYGNVSADEMMQLWMNSPGHRANILNSSYTHIGVGAARTGSGRVYGTQNFLTL